GRAGRGPDSRLGRGQTRVVLFGARPGGPLPGGRVGLAHDLADRYRVVVWDLPGSGRSSRAADGDYSVGRLAHDLRAVLGLAGGPAVLAGHSLGGMTILTYCRLYAETLGREVTGVALAHTTYTNPVRTARWAGLYTALQKPVIEPLLHLTVWLSPLVWAM